MDPNFSGQRGHERPDEESILCTPSPTKLSIWLKDAMSGCSEIICFLQSKEEVNVASQENGHL